jgi:drug/metabolite transporter (DMT)-like permease
MTIRLIGGSEPAAVIALWFHCATMILSVFPLLAGVPNKPVLLSGVDGSLMLGVAGTSFVAQLLSTRGLQRCQAAKAAAMGFTQVRHADYMLWYDVLRPPAAAAAAAHTSLSCGNA